MNDPARATPTAPVAVVPCSGIGKSSGSVSREAAYALCDALRPESACLVALAKLVLGETEACARVRSSPVITIDGCKLRCASKLVELSGGTIAREVSVLDAYRRRKDLKPEGIAQLDAKGLELARVIAAELAGDVDRVGTVSVREPVMPAPPAAPPGQAAQAVPSASSAQAAPPGQAAQAAPSAPAAPGTPSIRPKVGIITCSGEEVAEGTVTRLAVLEVLDVLRPGVTTSLCLPLFLAGDEGHRGFARRHPTIALDGCALRCAARATAACSAPPVASVVVTELAAELGIGPIGDRRHLDEAGRRAVAATAARVAQIVDEIDARQRSVP